MNLKGILIISFILIQSINYIKTILKC